MLIMCIILSFSQYLLTSKTGSFLPVLCFL